MNNQILKMIAARVAVFFAPLLVGLAVWLGLVEQADAERIAAVLTSNLGELIFGGLLLLAGLLANIRSDLRDTQAALKLPENSTLDDLAAKKKKKRGGGRPSPPSNTQRLGFQG
jgi:hypothetical protein